MTLRHVQSGGVTMNRSGSSKIFAVFGLGVGGIVAGLVIAELALRIAGISALPQGIFFMGDPDRGWAQRPGASGIWYFEGNASVTINSQGLRDSEHAFEKPPGTLRVAVVGDSFAAAFQVDQSDDFSSVLQRALERCPELKGRRVEVINFGVNAYGTSQELITLERKVWRYTPDVVVLAYYANDIYDDSPALKKLYPDYVGGPRPYFYYAGGRLVEDRSFAAQPDFQKALRETTDPASVFGEGFHRLLWRFRIWQLFSRVRPHPNMHRSEEPWLLNPPADENWTSAWHVTEGLLGRFNEEVKARGARFLLVIVSHSLQVYPGAEARKALLKSNNVSDVFYLNRRIEALGAREGFPVLSLAEPMQRYADEHHVFLHGFSNTAMGIGHWNEQGHRFAGEAMAATLCDILAGRPLRASQASAGL